MQLKERLRARVLSGQHSLGDPLLPETELANKYGVARNTVRQAMNELVSEGLIHRIPGKGTFVNPANPRLADNRMDAFASVVLVSSTDANEYYHGFTLGMEDLSRAHNHGLMICNSHNSIDKQSRIILDLIDKRLSGIAISPTTVVETPPGHIQILQDNGIPVVFHPRRVEGVKAPLIRWRCRDIADLAARELIAHGHRKVMFDGVYRYSFTEAYEKHFRNSLEKHGLELPDERVFYYESADCEDEIYVSEEYLDNILAARKDDVTAIFSAYHGNAEYLYFKAMQMGIKVPEELSIITLGHRMRDGSVVRKQLSTVVYDEYLMGKKAAELLHEMSTGRRKIDDESEIIVPVEFLPGNSLAIAAGAKKGKGRATISVAE